jgi:Transposase DDE domain.
MHKYPFTLVLIRVYDAQGNLRHPDQPLWLIVLGQQRQQLSLSDIHEAFAERGGMEHFFRFAKQNLLLDKFQTCETAHEENWWQIVCLAYLQLWVAREYASCLPRPWEKHLPQVRERHLSPTMVQRSFAGIIRQFGTLVNSPEPRNNSPNRSPGGVPT